jgi:hypothetical protein
MSTLRMIPFGLIKSYFHFPCLSRAVALQRLIDVRIILHSII